MAKRCDQCLTEGITLVPLRAGWQIRNSELDYVGRLLRDGYIYILDNKGKWYGYAVTEERYFKEFDVKNTKKIPEIPLIDATCNKGNNCEALKSFIRIPNPEKRINGGLKKLWAAYSPVKWTKEIIKKHENDDDGYRSKNMIEINVYDTYLKQFESLGKLKQKNGGGYELLNFKGYDYNPSNHFALEYLNEFINPFTSKSYEPNKTKELKMLGKELFDIDNSGNRVLSLVFSDPAGELIDLNDFMIQAKEKELFKEGSDEDYKFKTAAAIESMKPEIIYNGIGNFIDKSILNAHAAVEQADTVPNNIWGTTTIGQGILSEEERLKIYDEEIEKITYSRKIEAGQEAWSNFEKLINYKDMKQWINDNYVPKVNRVNSFLRYAAYIYLDILQDEPLRRQMEFNFDNKDDNSCADYTFTVQQFIGSTASQIEIGDVYKEMLLTKSIADEKNYLARVLVFNKLEAIDEIKKIDALSEGKFQGILELSWSTLSAEILGKVRSAYQKKLTLYYGDKVNLSLSEIIFDRYVETRKFTENLNHAGIALSRSDLLIGLFTNKNIAVITVNGDIESYVKSINKLLNETVNKLDGGRGSISKNDIDKAAKSFIKRMDAEGVLTKESNLVKLTVFVDKDAINNAKISKKVSLKHVEANYAYLTTSYYTRKEARKKTSQLSFGHKENMIASINKSIGFFSLKEFEALYKSQSSFKGVIKGNFVPTSLQAVACLSLWSAVKNSVGDDQIVAIQKFSGSVAMLVGGLLQYASDVTQLKVLSVAQKSTNSFLKAHVKTALKGEAKSIQYVSTGLKWTARGLTIGGAAVFAYYDFKSSADSYEQREFIMSGLYFGSAATGLISAGFLAWAAVGGIVPVIGWVALGLSIVIGITIMWWKKTPLEYWFKYCQWGIDSRWNSVDYEIKQLENALQGKAVDGTE